MKVGRPFFSQARRDMVTDVSPEPHPLRLSRVQLDDVSVGEEMLGTDLLALERPTPPDAGEFESARQVPMNQARDVQYRVPTADGEGFGLLGRLARCFGVHTHDAQRVEQEWRELSNPRSRDGGSRYRGK